MKSQIKRSQNLFGLMVLFAAVAVAQELPKEFEFKREVEDGILMLSVVPNAERMGEAGALGRTSQLLGVIAAPKDKVFLLMYMQMKPVQQLKILKDKSCTVGVGNDKFEFRAYDKVDSDKIGSMWLESVLLTVDVTVYEKLLAADAASFRCGSIRYALTSDNITALNFLRRELAKETESKP